MPVVCLDLHKENNTCDKANRNTLRKKLSIRSARHNNASRLLRSSYKKTVKDSFYEYLKKKKLNSAFYKSEITPRKWHIAVTRYITYQAAFSFSRDCISSFSLFSSSIQLFQNFGIPLIRRDKRHKSTFRLKYILRARTLVHMQYLVYIEIGYLVFSPFNKSTENF